MKQCPSNTAQVSALVDLRRMNRGGFSVSASALTTTD